METKSKQENADEQQTSSHREERLVRQFRKVRGAWCPRCKTEVGGIFICHQCGNTFMDGNLDPFATIEEQWIPGIVWWQPSTWSGGKWAPSYSLPNTLLPDP